MTDTADRPARRRRCWLFAFLAGLAAVSLALHAAKWYRILEVQGLFDQWSILAVARPLAQVKAERARYYEGCYFLSYPVSVSHAAAAFILHLNRISGPQRLLDVQLDPGLRGFGFKLTVGMEAAVSGDAQRQFAIFIEKFRAFPELTQLSWSALDPAGPENRVPLFSVNGQCEWQ